MVVIASNDDQTWILRTSGVVRCIAEQRVTETTRIAMRDIGMRVSLASGVAMYNVKMTASMSSMAALRRANAGFGRPRVSAWTAFGCAGPRFEGSHSLFIEEVGDSNLGGFYDHLPVFHEEAQSRRNIFAGT
ncbi:pyridoxine 5'-phosphate synthase [Striga asiatica]|uniref:Pyridoxine 5'-phosphate synthase n=1 Tax=Striga asiatica TaxID=4170 RepID=A0A5A7QZ44_STRAF|nr:pyridoxine 5'-phosphate synthase [Striga asiatica]